MDEGNKIDPWTTVIKGADISRGQKSEYTFTVTLFICGSMFLAGLNELQMV